MTLGFNTLRYEANFDGAGNGLAPDAGLTPGGLPHEAPPEPEAEAGWQGVSQDQWESQQEQLQRMSELVERLAPVAQYMEGFPNGQQQEQQGQEFDLFADDAEDRIRNLIREETAPFREIAQERQYEELTNRAKDILSSVESERGDLPKPQYEEGQDGPDQYDLAIQFARQAFPQMEARYGQGSVRADEEAIAYGYEQVKALGRGFAASRESVEQNQISALSSAPREPSGSGVASQPLVTTQPGGWDAFRARHGLT